MELKPLANFHFAVDIDGVPRAGFSEAAGLVSETEVIEYREGSDAVHVRKLTGLTKYGNVTLKRGYSSDSTLWDWHRTAIQGQVERRTVRITLLNEAREPVVHFRLRNAWISRYEGPELDGQGNCVAIETIVLTHEGLDLEFVR